LSISNNKGLIYRGYRIINWCPSCQTALSDAEVEYAVQDSFLWHLKYKAKDSETIISSSPTHPAPKPCWATPPSRCTPTTSAMRTLWAKR
jgi:isoleucyl-tRNA synthetase